MLVVNVLPNVTRKVTDVLTQVDVQFAPFWKSFLAFGARIALGDVTFRSEDNITYCINTWLIMQNVAMHSSNEYVLKNFMRTNLVTEVSNNIILENMLGVHIPTDVTRNVDVNG